MDNEQWIMNNNAKHCAAILYNRVMARFNKNNKKMAFTPCTGAIHCVSNGEAIET